MSRIDYTKVFKGEDLGKLLNIRTQMSIAKELGISQATLSRMIKKLGYTKTYAKSSKGGNEASANEN